MIVYWAYRIALALLVFVLIIWLLPLLLGLAGIVAPQNVITLLAIVAALLVLAGGWFGLGPKAPPPAA